MQNEKAVSRKFILFYLQLCSWVKLEENFSWKSQFIHHPTEGRVYVGHCHLANTGKWVCFAPSPPTNIPDFSCWEEGSEWQLGGGKRGRMTLGTQAFKWIRLTVPQETELWAQEMLEHLSACFLLTMCWEAESGDSKKSNYSTGEIHSAENGTRVLGVGSSSSHLKERWILQRGLSVWAHLPTSCLSPRSVPSAWMALIHTQE